jgi:NtrC-family two-component system sensor histidine kinase KinB
MTLKGKLLIAQLPLIVALLFIGTISAITTYRVGETSQIILQDNYRSILAIERIKEALERMDSATLFIIEGHRKEGEGIIQEHRQSFENELNIQKNNITEKGEAETTQRLSILWTEYKTKLAIFLAAKNTSEERNFYFNELLPLFEKIKLTAVKILAMNQDAMVFKSEHVRKVANRTNIFLFTVTIILTLLGITISIVLTSRLIRPISVLSKAVQRIGAGDMEARANITGSDEIAQLGEDFNKMAESIARYRQSSLGELFLVQQASQATIDGIPDPVFVFDTSGKMIMTNRFADEIFFAGNADNIADPLTRLDPSILNVIEHVKSHILSGKGPYNAKGFEDVVSIRSPQGEMHLLPQAAPVYEIEGTIIGVVVLLHDVTRFKRLSDLETDLVATTAHELKTPLTSLRMAIYICLEQTIGTLNDKQLDLLYAAREDCERLQTTVEELLDLAKIKLGRVTMKIRPVKVIDLLQPTMDRYAEIAKDHKVQLLLSYIDTGDQVSADPDQTHIVFDNLVTNALKHTPEDGTIELNARPEDSFIRFLVTDSGKGIPEEHLLHIFEKFYRIEDDTSGGAGLGLSIVYDIIDAQGGKVGVESIQGKGSTFWFTLPKRER